MGEILGASRRVLDPIDRVSEILFGLIMVLTFTGSLSVAESGRAEVREMLVGALGCNLIWGVIDGIFYLMGCLAERGRALMTLRAVRESGDAAAAQELISGALPPLIASVMPPAELESLRLRLRALPEPPRRARLDKDAWLGALGVFLLVFLSTFPVVVPFLFMTDVHVALRVSNAIAIVMMFAMGYTFGRLTGRGPLWAGSVMVVFGAILVSATIALGG